LVKIGAIQGKIAPTPPKIRLVGVRNDEHQRPAPINI